MRIAGHSVRDHEWDRYVAFALIFNKADAVTDKMSLKDIAKIQVESEAFQAEFDHWKIERDKK